MKGVLFLTRSKYERKTDHPLPIFSLPGDVETGGGRLSWMSASAPGLALILIGLEAPDQGLLMLKEYK
jgi:hypothetical protein